MSLSEVEMKRIEAEEIYRQEIRIKLERDKPPPPTTEKIWEYLNSHFTVWLLTSVVVGLITFAYSCHVDSVKREQEKKERSQKLEAEINNRRTETLKLLKYFKAKTNEAKNYDDPRFLYKEAVTFMDGKNDPDFPAFQSALYQEFKQENLTSLLIELEKVSETKGTEIKSLRTKYNTLVDLYSQTKDRAANDPALPTDEDKRINLEAVNKAIEILEVK